jgi:hypothetical protein
VLFSMTLVPAPVGSPADVLVDAELPQDPDEPILVAHAACAVLAAYGTEFRAGGFGDPQWRVDVSTDLAVIVPQLQPVYEQLSRREEAELAFYEQGVERSVFITPHPAADEARLECKSYGSWVPPQPVETATLSELVAMLDAFRHATAQEARRLWPVIAAYEPFAAWL